MTVYFAKMKYRFHSADRLPRCGEELNMNKEHWNGIDPNGDVPLEMLNALIEKSYELTKSKPKRRI